ncbi:uncharacterized protein B0H18DRAFT_1121296 [Fomitopsis serialis]|uniref:uncharacterized protein n=1 Tax=Fomitopsis serialis TaxID=139415 RepID=UPI002008652B|nr:uncharacterized protein B0H18DRAFT_1121296 [Neoantrodia serialis]KAH9921601.1 hypothetical protein B0H18DRAFT_1121296 [Neoantrodia serialis]
MANGGKNNGKGVDRDVPGDSPPFTVEQLQQLIAGLRLLTEQEEDRQLWAAVDNSSAQHVHARLSAGPSAPRRPLPNVHLAQEVQNQDGPAPTRRSTPHIEAPQPTPPTAGRTMAPTPGGGCHAPCANCCGGTVADGGDSTGVRWYCVTRGRAVGVFAGWPNASPLVIGVPNSVYQRFPTFSSALAAFLEAAANGTVFVVL